MTRSMTRWMLAGCMALVALGAVGARAQADPPANPFAGSWSGTWSHVEDEVVGTWDDWTISDAGRISGTFYSITNNFSGKIVGHVDADGNLVMIGVAVPRRLSQPGHGRDRRRRQARCLGHRHVVGRLLARRDPREELGVVRETCGTRLAGTLSRPAARSDLLVAPPIGAAAHRPQDGGVRPGGQGPASHVGRPSRTFVAAARSLRGEGKPLLPRRGGDLAVEADVREHRLAAVGRRVLDEEIEHALGLHEVGGVAGLLPEEEAGLHRLSHLGVALVRREGREGRSDVAAWKRRELRRREELDAGQREFAGDRERRVEVGAGLGLPALPRKVRPAGDKRVRLAVAMADLPAQSERFRVAALRRGGVAFLGGEVRERLEREALAPPVTDLPGDREAPLAVLPRLPEATEGEEDFAQVPGGAGLAPSVPDLPGEREVPLVVLPRLP